MESSPIKMRIKGKYSLDLVFSHESKGNTVGKTKLLIGIFIPNVKSHQFIFMCGPQDSEFF